MTFLDPTKLWFLVLVGVLMTLYIVAQLRRRHYAVVFTNLPLLASIAPRRPGWRRHLTAAAFLAMLTALVFALAKPAHATQVPDEHALVIIAIDASRSMGATDIIPTRLNLAREEASRLVADLPARVRVGLVVFAEQASLKVGPTANRTAVFDAIRTIQTSDGTAVGDAIFTALDTIRQSHHGAGVGAGAATPGGGAANSAIVILSDGESTLGRSTAEAVTAAKTTGVPISTIAVGTNHGTVRVDQVPFSVPVQRTALRQIADLSRGHHYDLTAPLQLNDVYTQLGSQLAHRSTPSELTGWFLFAALAAGALVVAGSIGWAGRVP